MKKNTSRRKYTSDFKRDAIQLVLKCGKSCSATERTLGIGQGILARWIKEYQSDPKESFPGNGKLKTYDAEMVNLRKENQLLRTERDILKKQWSSSPKHLPYLRIHKPIRKRVQNHRYVPSVRGFAQWLLCLAQTTAFQP